MLLFIWFILQNESVASPPQACFKGSWDLHKALHKLAKSSHASQSSKPSKQFNPWPGYMFTGKLRPAMQVMWSKN